MTTDDERKPYYPFNKVWITAKSTPVALAICSSLIPLLAITRAKLAS